MTTLVWFRQDLRLADNPALAEAAAAGEVIPVYVSAPGEEAGWGPGGASRWWLHQSLGRLRESLKAAGSDLCIRSADDTLQVLMSLVRETGATGVYWNRRYEPAAVARDARVKKELRAQGIAAESRNAGVLFDPWTVSTKSGAPFQVFTPYWRHCKSLEEPGEPLPAPGRLKKPKAWPRSEPLESLALLPSLNWPTGLAAAWKVGSSAAETGFDHFLRECFETYSGDRDRPAVVGTSRLSPHLHFGEIGPRQVWSWVRRYAEKRGWHTSWRDSQFLTELGWREFAHHLLYHFPSTPEQPLRPAFRGFPWVADDAALEAWHRGRTGYPIVDAGMRELWETGWMHNRVRMIVGSFLVKDLLLPWQAGAAWFWDTLVDADLANNTLGWQWVAGCGADAAPFFRIFNPVSQATRFDPAGDYVRRWLPELEGLPPDWVHRPWEAPPEVLRSAGVALGVSYPAPLVSHDIARKRALSAFQELRARK